jgi:hypothetical protein
MNRNAAGAGAETRKVPLPEEGHQQGGEHLRVSLQLHVFTYYVLFLFTF